MSGALSRRALAAAVALLAGVIETSVLAAQTTTLTGTVTTASTAEPLSGAQVSIEALDVGTLTRESGRYQFTSLPPGTYELRVTYLGYQNASQQVTVRTGETTRADFELTAAAINLDEIVVTGTGAPTERRRLGQTISAVSAEEMNMAPITTVGQALQGRIPGLTGGIGNRETGQADLMVLRGITSLTQRNQPLIYVDGIRLNNRTFVAAGLTTDQLSQINPADIERIEVIRGAAAATLFGTEASSGVIQIFTKRGQAGAPVYSFQMDQQIIQMPQSSFPTNYGYDAETGQILADKPSEVWVELGHQQNYTASIQGGTPGTRYSVSGRLMYEDGPLPNNDLMNASARATLDFQHTDRLRSSLDVNLLRKYLEAPRPSWSSIVSEMVLANPAQATEIRPHGEQDFTVAGSLKDRDEATTTTILVGGSLYYDLMEDLTAQLKAGHHYATRRRERMRPEGEVLGLAGIREVWGDNISATTLEGRVAWETDITDRIQSSLVIGGQSFLESTVSEYVSVQDFASPTLRTLRGGSTITGVDEFTEEVINAGVFLQEQIGLDNRLFVTAGVRVDGNSAFGEDFGLEAYPKAGLSWVLSDYDFWRVPAVDEFRLRGAVGSSGLQPGAFDAQRTWRSISFIGGPAVAPLNLGNADLKPERSTEREIGIEAGMFAGRLGLELIYFDQTTEDALLPRSPAPSTAFTSPQLENLGTIASDGVELSASFRALDRPGFRWDVNAAFTHTDQVVEGMGGVPNFRLQDRYRWGWIAEGYRPGAVIAPIQDPDQPYVLAVPVDQLTNLDQIQPNTLKNAAGEDSLVFMGNPQPTWTVDFGSTFQIGDDLTLRTLFSGAGGDYVISNETEVIRSATASNYLIAWSQQILSDPNATTEQRQEVADTYGRKHPNVVSSYMESGDYLRWGELSLIYRLPEQLTGRIGLRSTSVSLGARNLAVWTGYSGMIDPGTSATGWPGEAGVFMGNIDYISAPSTRRFFFSVQTTW